MECRIISDQIYKNGEFVPGEVLVVDGKIVENDPFVAAKTVNLTGTRVIPGLIDTHIHGFKGFDTMDCKKESLLGMAEELAKNGVTTFYPTTVTSPDHKLKKAVELVGELSHWDCDTGGARIGGSYLEGPYINPKLKGAHPEEEIKKVSIEMLKSLNSASKGTMRTVAIAPEMPGGMEAISLLREMGITVTIGHSAATVEQAKEAINRGARATIHLFNAMNPLHHREPSLLGATLTTDGYSAEIICDGIHVSPVCVHMLAKCKRSEDILLITDCMCAGGMEDGSYMLGELDVDVKSGIARTKDGALAGSTLKLMRGVVNFGEFSGKGFAYALRMATENPARQMGIWGRTGSIQPGKSADIVAIDSDYNVVFSMVNGRIIKK